MMRATAALLAGIILAGCECGGEPLASSDGGVDAPPAVDAQVALDAPEPDDAAASLEDAAVDAGIDAPAFSCSTCAPAGDCETLRCAGSCDYDVVEDGVGCGTDGVCVAGLCAARGCGDGLRELGPDPAREGCDDGNAIDSDLCASCAPVYYPLVSVVDREDTTYGPHAVELDGRGHALALFTTITSGASLHAQRFDARAAPEGTPLDLGAGPTAPGAMVVGLEAGWAVVTSSTSTTIRIVAPDGTVGPARSAALGSTGALRDTTLAVLSTGEMLAGWSDITSSTANRVYLRWLGADAVPAEAPVLASPTGAVAPAIARSGADVLLVTWTDLPAAASPRLVGRRMARSGWIDPEPFELFASRPTSVALAPSASGWWVAFVSNALDSAGDVYVHAVAHAGAPVTGTATRVTGTDGSSRAELAPSIASAGDGWIVGWEVGYPRQVELALGAGAAVGPELATLSPLLVAANQRGVSLARSERGTWVLWSDSRLGELAAIRSPIAFLLPPP